MKLITIQIGAFEEINVDKARESLLLHSKHAILNVVHKEGFPKFATIAIALGSLYMTVVAIELFGVTAAVMVRNALQPPSIPSI